MRLPARPDVVHLLRAAIASAAASLDMTVDALDDLGIAVNEACAALLRLAGIERLTMRVAADGNALEARIWGDVPAETWPPPGWESSMSGHVLATLTEDVTFVTGDEDAGIQFTVTTGRI